jgi:tetratricopeptide (TPR) repeat protein
VTALSSFKLTRLCFAGAWIVAAIVCLRVPEASASGVASGAASHDDGVEQPAAGKAAVSEGDAKNQERAQEAYKQGASAFTGGRYLEAVHWFEQADRYVPDGRLCYNIALAYEALNASSDGLRWYREYLRRVPDAEDRSEVERSVRRLEARLATSGVQQVTVLSTPSGARVVLDGLLVGTAPWTGETTPGRHRVVLRLEGHEDVASDIELSADRAQEVSLVFSGSGRSTSPAPGFSGSHVSATTWVVLGVGTVAFAGAGLFEWMRADSEQDARSAPDQIAAQKAFERMENRQLEARLSLGLGIAAGAVGSYLLWRDLSSTEGTSVGAGCGFGSCGVVARGAF